MEKHIQTYADYGIGLKKSVGGGAKNNLTPIHYIPTKNSETWYPQNLSMLYSFAGAWERKKRETLKL